MARRGTGKVGAYDRTVGERVRVLREGQRLSMAKLAARVSPPTTDSQINKLEKGIVEMTVEWVYRLGTALGVDPLTLLEPGGSLSAREKALVDLYRGLDPKAQETVWRVADALPKSPVKKSNDNNNDAGSSGGA